MAGLTDSPPRLHPYCIESTDESAHAGSGNVVHRDSMFLQPLEYTDVRKPSRPNSSCPLENCGVRVRNFRTHEQLLHRLRCAPPFSDRANEVLNGKTPGSRVWTDTC